MSADDYDPWPLVPQSDYPELRLLESFQQRATDLVQDTALRRLGEAIKDFPELLDRTVTVACLRENTKAVAQADSLNGLVYLPTDVQIGWQTAYHELGHFAIRVRDDRGEDVPRTSEEFCSIFSVARMPPERCRDDSRDDIAYLGTPEVPREEWPGICRRALEYRRDNHDYIKQCRAWLGIGGGEA